jgi:hypothetical protein
VRARRVRTPGGREWVVRRHWLPRLRGETLWARFSRRIRAIGRRLRGANELSAVDGCASAAVDDFVVVSVVILLLLLAVFVAVPLLIAVVDVLVVLVLSLLGIVGRVVFRRPWLVEARSGEETREWRVVGWRASRVHVDQVAADLQAGRELGTA